MKNNLGIIFALFYGIVIGVASYGSYVAHTRAIPEKEIEYVYVTSEPEVITETIYVEVEPEFYRNYSEEDGWYFKDYAMREGEGEGVVGMLWLMYTFENRCEVYGNTPAEEWASSASESSMFRSGIEPNEDCLKAYELFIEGWIPKPLYFRAGHYHSFGTELCQVGSHYFSTK